MMEGRSRQCVSESWTFGVLDLSDWCVVSFLSGDELWSAVRTRLLVTDEERSFCPIAFWVITRDIESFPCVECMLKPRTVEEFVCHSDGREEGEMHILRKAVLVRTTQSVATWGQATEEDLKTGGVRLILTEAMGRLYALVHAQLVRAQHADAAPGAVDNDASVSGM
ncbi:hypothetical protein IEO21_09533 [Rhodonia placenta]|uniref:Uncharacterized protein n=1 Tax=Rhodonia placenta TaxID=104341 RepID=A0A8H7TXM9_9APHY|nr:hypothetical protein IEO21_09533 [Postia placenta]